MNSENKIVVTSWNGNCHQADSLHLQYDTDALCNGTLLQSVQVSFPKTADWIEEEYGYSHDEIMDFADELAERFEDKFDCNVSENDDWVARIIEMFDAAGRKESNDD